MKNLTIEDLVTDERIESLQRILNKYDDIPKAYKEFGEYPHKMIADTFTFDKRFTSIDVCSVSAKRINQFMADLSSFFFVSNNLEEVHISRFKTLCDVAIGKLEIDGEIVRLSDRFADLAGAFYNYSPKKILQYCLDRELYHLIKF